MLSLACATAGLVPFTAQPQFRRAVSTATNLHMSTLYDMPVSNHGARVRLLLYKKGLESEVTIAKPGDLGGLVSEEYKALNPQCKMPLLVDEDEGVTVYEADAICRHVLDKHADAGPSLVPSTLAGRTRAELICRLHDAYVGPIQGCLYKPAPPFGRFTTRASALRELRAQLDELERLADPAGPYLAGDAFSLADATFFPTVAFVVQMLPKFDEAVVSDGAANPDAAPLDAAAGALGPRLLAWWAHMSTVDAEGMRVLDELRGGLDAWEQPSERWGDNRWAPLLHAGTRDDAPRTLFDKILSKEIPSEVVYEDDVCLAFKDINPAAPTHVLIIPKERDGLTGLGAATAEHAGTLGHLMVAAAKIAKQEGLDDFRVVTNNGESAGQSVFHLHLHLIGGRELAWPPG